MVDYYRVLGLDKTATAREIKDAFRRLALEFHPDKHTQSPSHVRDDAARRFKQIAEAYDVLGDAQKRADYNIRSHNSNSNYNYNYNGGARASHDYNNYYYRRAGSSYSTGYRGAYANPSFYIAMKNAILRNVAFASILFGGVCMIDWSSEALWKSQNSGKSFEVAMESIEQAKADKDRT